MWEKWANAFSTNVVADKAHFRYSKVILDKAMIRQLLKEVLMELLGGTADSQNVVLVKDEVKAPSHTVN